MRISHQRWTRQVLAVCARLQVAHEDGRRASRALERGAGEAGAGERVSHAVAVYRVADEAPRPRRVRYRRAEPAQRGGEARAPRRRRVRAGGSAARRTALQPRRGGGNTTRRRSASRSDVRGAHLRAAHVNARLPRWAKGAYYAGPTEAPSALGAATACGARGRERERQTHAQPRSTRLVRPPAQPAIRSGAPSARRDVKLLVAPRSRRELLRRPGRARETHHPRPHGASASHRRRRLFRNAPAVDAWRRSRTSRNDRRIGA